MNRDLEMHKGDESKKKPGRPLRPPTNAALTLAKAHTF